jgi:hypothetical protein
MQVQLTDEQWDGESIPEAHRCGTPGASSPPFLVTDIPPTGR